jgi:diacylglycerol kinase (ATP)
MKIAIIINPTSGKGNGMKFFEQIKRLHKNNSNIEYFLTEKPLHAIEIAKNVSNYDKIIVCGGDGTLHEVINGFDLNSNTKFGLLPIGSGNDFSLSFHRNKVDVLSLLNFYLSESPIIREVNFGDVQITDANDNVYNKRMINSFGVGFDAKVAFFKQNNKVLSGSLSYIYSILKTLFEFDKIDFNGIYDNKQLSGNALFCAVGNGQSVGGGLYLMPNAKVDDNILDLSVVSINSRFKLLTLLPKAMSNSLTTRKELTQYQFNNLELTLNTPFYTHIDGEVITDIAKFINVTMSEHKLNFMCRG